MATIFKRDSGDRPTPIPTTALAGFILNDLADEGRARVEQVRQESEQLLADARSEAARLRVEAEQQGYADGLQRAAVDADAKLQVAAEERAQSGLELVQSAIDQIYLAHQQWMNEFSQSLHMVALAATKRVLQRELTFDPQLIVSWAEQAVRSTRGACRLTVAVHPETLALIGPSLDQMLSAPDLPEQTIVEPDDSVGPTEVIVRQAGGEVHAGLNAQLERLAELLA